MKDVMMKKETESHKQETELLEDYIAKAEQVIKRLPKILGKNYQNFTTTKLRNILSMVNDIYNDILTEPADLLNPEIQNRIQYLKVRLVYECGREPKVIKPFVEEAGLLPMLANIGNSRKRLISFVRYMEALVAYHRYYGGRD